MADKLFQYSPYKNVYILDNHVPYRREVVRYLDLIRTTHAGRTLLKFVSKSPKWMFIVPYKPTAKDPVNAYAQFQNETDAYARNQPVMRGFAIPGFGTLMLPTAQFGTGAGSNTWVKYHPATFRQYVLNKHRIPQGAGPGEILFHEVLHAMRMMHGTFIRTTVPENIGMDDFEEFCAVVASNIYRSERGFKSIRESHWGFTPESLSEPIAYYKYYKDPIQRWFRSQQDFCLELAGSPAAFNPLRYAAAALDLPVKIPMAL